MKETDTLLQENNLESAIDAIKNGEVIGIPTETVYGIGVDPYSQTAVDKICLLYTSPSPRDVHLSRMPSSA